MNRQDVMTMISHADPVPDVENLPSAAWSNTELLHVIDERREHMHDQMDNAELETIRNQQVRWRLPLLAALAAFVLVIATVGIVALVADKGDPFETAVVPTTTPAPTTSAQTTSTSTTTTAVPLGVGPFELTVEQQSLIAVYLEARNGSSWDEYIALFAPGTPLERSGALNPSWVNSLETEVEIFDFLAAIGFDSEELRCQQYPPRVVCTFLNHTAGTEAFNLDPWRMIETFEFGDAGLITYFKADMTQYPAASWERFSQWVEDNHPEQRHLLGAAGQEFNYDTDPIIALELLDEYGAYLDGK